MCVKKILMTCFYIFKFIKVPLFLILVLWNVYMHGVEDSWSMSLDFLLIFVQENIILNNWQLRIIPWTTNK